MVRLLLCLLICTPFIRVSGQQPSIFGEIRVTQLEGKDFIQKVKVSKNLCVFGLGKTGICEIGTVDGRRVGIQLEALTSNLNDSLHLVLGVALYTHEGGLWRLYQQPYYSRVPYYELPQGGSVGNQAFQSGGYGIEDIHMDLDSRFFLHHPPNISAPDFNDGGATMARLREKYQWEAIEYNNWGDTDKDSILTVGFINSRVPPNKEDFEGSRKELTEIVRLIQAAVAHPEHYNSYRIVFITREKDGPITFRSSYLDLELPERLPILDTVPPKLGNWR